MPKRNMHDEVVEEMVAERQQWRDDARKASPVPAGSDRLSMRDYRNRLMQMSPQEQAREYQKDKDAFMKAIAPVRRAE